MRLCAGLSCTEFALLARPRATSRATDSLYLFESGFLGLHGRSLWGNPEKKKWLILHGDIGWLLNRHYAHSLGGSQDSGFKLLKNGLRGAWHQQKSSKIVC
jgi:hypothetical protein